MAPARRPARWIVAMLVLGATSSPLAARAATTSAERPTDRAHTVGRGDTLSGIARPYRVSVPALARANGLPAAGARLRVGARLTIPAVTVAARPAVARPRVSSRGQNGFVSVYAHDTENLVELGQWVTARQPIPTVGRSGRATAEHLHFEIRHEGRVYNPLHLLPLPPRIVVEELDLDEDDES